MRTGVRGFVVVSAVRVRSWSLHGSVWLRTPIASGSHAAQVRDETEKTLAEPDVEDRPVQD